MTAQDAKSAGGTTLKATPSKVTLGDTGFTVKNRHYRYQDVIMTRFDREVVTTVLIVVPAGRSYGATMIVAMKNGDFIGIVPRTGLKSSAQKVTDMYHRFLSLSFKYRWETYMEKSERMGYLWFWGYAFYRDGRVMQDNVEIGRISNDMAVVGEPGKVRIGSVEIPTDRDPDILFAMLDAYFEIKCV